MHTHHLRSIWHTWPIRGAETCQGGSLCLECCHLEAVDQPVLVKLLLLGSSSPSLLCATA